MRGVNGNKSGGGGEQNQNIQSLIWGPGYILLPTAGWLVRVPLEVNKDCTPWDLVS